MCSVINKYVLSQTRFFRVLQIAWALSCSSRPGYNSILNLAWSNYLHCVFSLADNRAKELKRKIVSQSRLECYSIMIPLPISYTWYLETLLQPYPKLAPSTPFGSFDYVKYQYADILDSIASVFIIWSASSIFLQCLLSVFGRTTRTIALKDFVNRAINVSIAPLWTNRSTLFTPLRPKISSNVLLRLAAVFAALVLIGIDALVVFAQTPTVQARSLNDLELKRYSFKEPSSKIVYYEQTTGCRNIVQSSASGTVVPLYFCIDVDMQELESVVPNETIEISYGTLNDRYHVIVYPVSYTDNTFVAVQKYSFQLRDEQESLFYYANITSWGLTVSPSNLKWISDLMNKEYPLRGAKVLPHNETFSKIHAQKNDNWNLNLTFIGIELSLQMITLSADAITVNDFIGLGDQTTTDSSQLITKTVEGKVKRVSGISLWIIVAVLEAIRIISEKYLWNISNEIDEMVAHALGLESRECLKYKKNFPFEIVGHEIDLDDTSNESCTTAQKTGLWLRPKHLNMSTDKA